MTVQLLPPVIVRAARTHERLSHSLRGMILPDALEAFMPDAQSNLLYRIYPGSARVFCLRTHEIVGIKMRQISFRLEKPAAEADVALSVVAPAERSGVTRTGREIVFPVRARADSLTADW